ncbi:MAG: STAS domain-containing protein [Armatimonadetes bacterium]|jgi:anti-anti-sigma factor|nr:STAS domain-containing protein [Armatimonadota bacterium]HOC30671.1 STAS domain-containing protein [Armatimonadota bacterium]
MNATTRTENGRLVIAVTGRLDSITSPEFDAQAVEWKAEPRNIAVLDASGLEYISSAGLRSLLALAKRLMDDNSQLVVCGARGLVEEVLRMSGFDKLIPMYGVIDDIPAPGA